MADVFISYSRRDGEFVHALHDSLTTSGRDVWVDWQDIPPTSKWEQDIDDSIDAAESFVFVLSRDSLASEYCRGELQHAVKRGKRIVPIAIDGARPEDAPPELRELNWIWWRADDDADAALAKLASALDTDLEWSRAHTRLLVRAVEWDERRDGSLLLRGKDLAAAERTLAANAGKEPRPTELQERYLHQSRRSAARRQRALLGGVTIALAVSAALGVLALLQRNDARSATRKATSVALSSTSDDRLDANVDQALLLGLAAYDSSPSPQARGAVTAALQRARGFGVERLLRGDAPARRLAFAADGRTLAVGGADGNVRLWDVRAGESVGELKLGKPIAGVAFSRGETLAAAGEDGIVRLWDVTTRRPVGRAFRTGRPVTAAALSADGRTLAAGGNGRVWIWDVEGDRSRVARRITGEVETLAFSPDGRTLAAGSVISGFETSSGKVRLWDVASRARLGDLPTTDVATTVAFAPDGTLLTAGYRNPGSLRLTPVLRLWNARDLEPRGPAFAEGSDARQPFSLRAISAAAFAPDGRTIAAAREDGSVQVLSARTLKPAGPSLKGLPERAVSVAFGADGRIAAAADGRPTVWVWPLRDRGTFGRAADREGNAFALSPDGKTVATGPGSLGDGIVRLVQPGAETSLRPERPRPQYFQLAGLSFSPNGQSLAAAYDDGSVRLWDVESLREVGRLQARAGVGEMESMALAFSPDSRALAVTTSDGWVRTLDVGSGRLRDRFGVPGVVAAAYAADGALVTVGRRGAVRTWRDAKPAGQPLRPLDEQVDGVAFSADGDTLAFATPRAVRVWERRAGAQTAELPGSAGVFAVALSPDGRTLSGVNADSAIRLWDVPSGTLLGRPFGQEVRSTAFSADGLVLASGGDAMRLWEGILWQDDADLRAQVCRLAVGDITRDEWAAIAPGLGYRSVCG